MLGLSGKRGRSWAGSMARTSLALLYFGKIHFIGLSVVSKADQSPFGTRSGQSEGQDGHGPSDLNRRAEPPKAPEPNRLNRRFLCLAQTREGGGTSGQ